MIDLKDFYQQQFHKLEKVSDILSEVIIEFQKRTDNLEFRDVQDFLHLYRNLKESSNIIEFTVMADMVSNGLVKQNSYIPPVP